MAGSIWSFLCTLCTHKYAIHLHNYNLCTLRPRHGPASTVFGFRLYMYANQQPQSDYLTNVSPEMYSHDLMCMRCSYCCCISTFMLHALHPARYSITVVPAAVHLRSVLFEFTGLSGAFRGFAPGLQSQAACQPVVSCMCWREACLPSLHNLVQFVKRIVTTETNEIKPMITTKGARGGG